jgi:hypothetical protein
MNWCQDIFECRWKNGMTSFSGSDADGEYLVCSVFSDGGSDLQPFQPSEKIRFSSDVSEIQEIPNQLSANLALRICQSGIDFQSHTITQISPITSNLPLNFKWAKKVIRQQISDECELVAGISACGKKTLLYFDMLNPNQLYFHFCQMSNLRIAPLYLLNSPDCRSEASEARNQSTVPSAYEERYTDRFLEEFGLMQTFQN